MEFIADARVRLFALLAIVCLLLFAGLNRGGLSGYDDALYAHEAKEMLRADEWRDVRFNGDLNLEYPPLFVWFCAASMKVFGVNDFAAKLPATLAGVGTVALLFGIAWELTRNRWFATWAALVLATTQQFLKYSSHAMSDVPFTFLVVLAIYLYLRGLRRPAFLVWMGVPIGLALLTRSVLGLTPLLIVTAHSLLAGRRRDLLSPQFFGGIAVAVGLPLLWIIPSYQAHGSFLFEGHFAFVFRKVEGGGGSLTFQVWPYVKELATYYWPWLPVFVAGLWIQRRELLTSLAPVWILLVALPLTQTAIPYGRYLMPAFPAMALVCAAALDRWIPEVRRIVCFVGAGAILLLAGAYTVIFPAPERGVDIRMLAPIAESRSRPDQRLLLYTFGEQRYDFQNQLLWYADRYTDQIVDMEELVANHEPGRVGVIDKGSFAQLPDKERLEVLAESELFYCYLVR